MREGFHLNSAFQCKARYKITSTKNVNMVQVLTEKKSVVTKGKMLLFLFSELFIIHLIFF